MIAETRANAAHERIEAARSAAAEQIVSEAIGAAVESAIKEAEAAKVERDAAEAERNSQENAVESSAPLDSAGVPVEISKADSGSGTRAPLILHFDGVPAEDTQGSAGSPADSDNSFEKVEKASPESRGSGTGTPEAGGMGEWVMVNDASGASTPESEARSERKRNGDVEADVTVIAKHSEDAREHREREEAFRAEARARALERAAVRAEEVLNNSSHALLLENARALGIATSGRGSRRASVEKTAALAMDASLEAAAGGNGEGEISNGSENGDLQRLEKGDFGEEVEVLTLTERRPVIWGTARFRHLWTGAVQLGEAQEPRSEAELVEGNGEAPEGGGEPSGDVSFGWHEAHPGKGEVTSIEEKRPERQTSEDVAEGESTAGDVKLDSGGLDQCPCEDTDESAEKNEIGETLLQKSCAPQEAESSSPVVRRIAWPIGKGHVAAGDCAVSCVPRVEQDLLPGCYRAMVTGSAEADSEQISATPMLSREAIVCNQEGPSFELDEMD